MPAGYPVAFANPAPLPTPDAHGYVSHDAARLYYASYGAGAPVILLHGAFGNGEDWGNQVPALVDAGHRAILIDTRGHGRSTRDARAFRYEHLASDVLAVMDTLQIPNAALIGSSDGAIIALMLAMHHPTRITRVFAFGANMDLSGLQPVPATDRVIARVFAQARRDYLRLSETPAQFSNFAAAVEQMMATQPNVSAADLARIATPVAIVHAAHDEFIPRAHADYLVRTIPDARLITLPGVSHFASLQRPADFNAAMLEFLDAP